MKKDVVQATMDDLGEAVSKSQDEMIFRCPFCISRRGKEDRVGKLYFNPLKRIGWCHKCEVVVVSDLFETEEEQEEWVKQLYEHKSKVVDFHIPLQFNLLHWTEPINKEHRQYLVNRGFIGSTAERYGFLSTREGFGNGIVLPNKQVEGYTDFLQIRKLDPGRGPKYYGLSSSKPLMYADLVDTKRIALAEGSFSAASIYQASGGRISPMAIMGKYLSEIQCGQLQEAVNDNDIEVTYLVLDGGFNTEVIKLARQIEDNVHGTGEINIVRLPDGRDPNDMISDENLMGHFEESLSLDYDLAYRIEKTKGERERVREQRKRRAELWN